jgi:hypothetical protein
MNDPRRDELEDLYRASIYVIHDGDTRIETRIDRPCALLAARLAAAGTGRAALLSACNPQGRELDPETNVQRQGELEAALVEHALAFLPALGRSPDGSWEEPSVLLLDVSEATARDWAARWDQVAFVYYDAEGRGRLHFVEDGSS